MRSLCRWLILATALASLHGCCLNPAAPLLCPAQTPVAVHGAQRLRVRPMRGGDPRCVRVPDGFLLAEPPPADWQAPAPAEKPAPRKTRAIDCEGWACPIPVRR